METAPEPQDLRARILLVIGHVLGAAGTFWLANLLRFDFSVPPDRIRLALALLAPVVVIKVLALLTCGVYRIVWNYVSLRDLRAIVGASFLATAVIALFDTLVMPRTGLPRLPGSVLVIDGALTCLWVAGTYFVARTVHEVGRARRLNTAGALTPVVIVGAGDAGELLLRDLEREPRGLRVVRFLDDHRDKIGRRVRGIDVDGPIADGAARAARENIRKAIIAIPSASPMRMRQIAETLLGHDMALSVLPSDAPQDAQTAARLRDLKIEDLLRRDPVRRDPEELRQSYRYRAILVTGAAGSIGSEICRQLLQLEAARIIAVDRAETPLVLLEQELRTRYPDQRVQPILADVTDARRMRAIISEYKPSAVFHAAAVKHVPVAESCPAEAIRVNVLGTRNVVDLATELGVPRIVLISTDKAVRPANVMGATKRVAELVVQSRGGLAVRFGNVLGSNGSVVNIFREQIQRGGPVTITHPDMRRFFMTIPEAVHLVLETARFGRSGGVYMLDMGQPVKIVDLARDMIRLAGLRPESDIPITFTGVRPGEKLYEDLCMEDEQVEPTEHPQIVVARGQPANRARADEVTARFESLLADSAAADQLVAALHETLPEYAQPEPAGAKGA